MAKDPKNADHLAVLGILLYRTGNYHEAHELIGKASGAYADGKSLGSVAHAQFLMTAIEWQLGRKEEAKRVASASNRVGK